MCTVLSARLPSPCRPRRRPWLRENRLQLRRCRVTCSSVPHPAAYLPLGGEVLTKEACLRTQPSSVGTSQLVGGAFADSPVAATPAQSRQPGLRGASSLCVGFVEPVFSLLEVKGVAGGGLSCRAS